jgi:hypothetical protein
MLLTQIKSGLVNNLSGIFQDLEYSPQIFSNTLKIIKV